MKSFCKKFGILIKKLRVELKEFDGLFAVSPKEFSRPAVKDKKRQIEDTIKEIKEVPEYEFNLPLRDKIAKEKGFEWVSNFRGELAVAWTNNLYYVVNKSGERILDQGFADYRFGSEKIMIVRDPVFQSSSGVIERPGRWRFFYPDIKNLSEDLYGKCLAGFSDGFAIMGHGRDQDGKDIGCIVDEYGRKIYIENFDEAKPFKNGVARVRKNGMWFFINTDGDYLFNKGYNELSDYYEGFAYAQEKPLGQIIRIDKKGEVLGSIDERYNSFSDFSEGIIKLNHYASANMMTVSEDYYFDRNGSEVIHDYFGRATDFSEGLAVVSFHGFHSPLCYIDKTGEKIIEGKFWQAEPFKDRVAKVRNKGGLWYLMNKAGKNVSARGALFKSIGEVKDGVVEVVDKRGDRYYIDTNGNEIF